MLKIINKIVHKFLNYFNYKIVPTDNVLNLKLDNLKILLDKDFDHKNSAIENFLVFICKNFKNSHSQLFQDLFVHFFLKKKNGLYCEVGALDGYNISNTYYLEKHLGWKGILCEPNKSYYNQLKKKRSNNVIIKKPVYSENNINVLFAEHEGGRSEILEKNTKNNFSKNKSNTYYLKTTTLNEIFSNHLKKNIDYLSIDTEGTEYEILKTLDFQKYKPNIITIEHNYEIKKRKKIYNLLISKNYIRIFKSISRFEDWYVRKNILK
jgi:FkbM family methyltransferase